MNTAIATRLLWKEYRQQRNLWFALLFGATLLQVIFWFFIEEPRTGDDDFMLLPLHVGTAAMITGLFTVCSAAISFAIEREEGTHLRLVSLSCPPGLTLSIKFLVGLLGTVLLFAVSASIGACLSVGVGAAINSLREANSDELLAQCYWITALVGSSLVVGAFFSLVFRKVLPAVIAATVVTLVGWPLLFSSWEASYGVLGRPDVTWLMAVSAVGIGVLGLIDYLLVRWWMNRGFSDTPRVRSRSLFRRLRVQRDGLDGSVTLEIGGADRAEFEVLTTDQARILPPPCLGLSLLYNNWGRGRARVLKFLCWKEMAESRRLFLAMWGFGLLLAIYGGIEALELANTHYRNASTQPFAFGFAILSMFVCGLMTFRAEQSQDNYRLLSDHGVTPGYVWASKQIVWLGRMLAIPLTMLVVYSLIARLQETQFEPRMVLRSRQDWDKLPSLWWLSDCLKVVATLLTFYSVTQMASLTWRRAALSIFFALLCCVLLGMWMGATTYFEVPVFVGILPLAPALLLMTRLRTRGWLIGDDRFKRWLLPGTFGFLGIAACWLTTATWRIFEIPTAEPIVVTKTLDDGSTAETINGLTEAERAAILAPVSDSEKEAAGLYEKAAISGPRLVDFSIQAADLDSCVFESPAADVLIKRSVTRLQMYVLADHVLARAKREAEAGETERGLSLIGDAFKIARHAAGRGANRDFDQWRMITFNALHSLVEWSAIEGVNAELAAEASGLVKEHMERSPDLFAVSFAHHRIVRNTLKLAFDEMRALRQRGDSFDTNKYFEQYMMLRFPGTNQRIDRLIDWYEVRSATLIAEAHQVEAQGTSTGQSLGSWYRKQLAVSSASSQSPNLPEHKRWLRSTPIPGGIVDDIGLSLVFVRARTQTASRGTQIAMQINLARRESGELPASLDELGIPKAVLIEPWSGRQFAWYPEGVPNEIKSTQPVVPANTPFLFSGGPMEAYLQEGVELVRLEDSVDTSPDVTPVDGDAAAGREDSTSARPDAPTLPETSLTGGPAGLRGADDTIGFSDFESMPAGMGSGMEPDGRWEERRVFRIREADPGTGPIAVKPTVWLFPRRADEVAADEEAGD